MKKKFKWFASLILSAALVSACGTSTSGDNDGESNGGDKPSQLIIATGGTSGTYYPLGGAMAKLITDATGVTTTATSTSASVENMRLIRDGSADIAFTQSDIAEYAMTGANMFEQEGGINGFHAIGSLYNETIQIVVAKDSNINSVADLKGKRVSVGAPGSGTESNAQQILEAYGLTFDDLQVQRLSFGDSAKAIQNGQLDAAFQTAGAPTAAITELATTKGVKIISLDQDKIDMLKLNYPFYVETTIPGGTYSTVPEDVKTVSVRATLIVRSDLNDDLVYNITKTIYENVDKLPSKQDEIKVEDAFLGVTAPIHPGAQKYFDEKGITQ